MAGFAILWAFVALSHVAVEASPPVSASKTLLFGPGLGKDTSYLPLNYFFIQARDASGKK